MIVTLLIVVCALVDRCHRPRRPGPTDLGPSHDDRHECRSRPGPALSSFGTLHATTVQHVMHDPLLTC